MFVNLLGVQPSQPSKGLSPVQHYRFVIVATAPRIDSKLESQYVITKGLAPYSVEIPDMACLPVICDSRRRYVKKFRLAQLIVNRAHRAACLSPRIDPRQILSL